MNHLYTALNVLETEYGSGQQVFVVSKFDSAVKGADTKTAAAMRDKGERGLTARRASRRPLSVHYEPFPFLFIRGQPLRTWSA